jgi:hypothetical protein
VSSITNVSEKFFEFAVGINLEKPDAKTCEGH